MGGSDNEEGGMVRAAVMRMVAVMKSSDSDKDGGRGQEDRVAGWGTNKVSSGR